MRIRLRPIALSVAGFLILPSLAHAQATEPGCKALIDATAARIPDLSGTPDAAQQLGLTKEQLQAALAALDAARLVHGSNQRGCLTMVNAARNMLARGAAALDDDRSIVSLEVWAYEPLYESAWRAKAFIDQVAFNKAGQQVGEVHDILMKPDGTLTGIIVEGGGVLDIGDTHARVNWQDVRFRDAEKSGVIVPLEKAKMTDFSLFSSDEKSGPRIGAKEVRLSSVLGERVRLQSGEFFGYIDDLLISNGEVKATLVRTDIGYRLYGPHRYATPYYAYHAGLATGADYYVLPYSSEQLARLEGFDIEKVKGPSDKSEPDKSSS